MCLEKTSANLLRNKTIAIIIETVTAIIIKTSWKPVAKLIPQFPFTLPASFPNPPDGPDPGVIVCIYKCLYVWIFLDMPFLTLQSRIALPS